MSSALRLYIGQGYRVDVSSEAGDKWDINVTGFRAEVEIAFDARPVVELGKVQKVTGLIPQPIEQGPVSSSLGSWR